MLAALLSPLGEVPASAAAGRELIVFSSPTETDDQNVYSIAPDGTARTRLTFTDAQETSPALSPDGTRIVFLSDRLEPGEQSGVRNLDLYTMAPDGSDVTRLTTTTANESSPAWSPDGRSIVFSDGADLYTMAADGTGRTRLTTHPAVEDQPAWSPDGTQIAFMSTRNGNFDLYRIGVDGSGEMRLTEDAAGDFDPAWSPDGSRIAFSSDRDSGDSFNEEVYTMAADGSDEVNRSRSPGADARPAWSPDSTQLVFYSNRNGPGLYRMAADGSAPVQLTRESVDLDPSWAFVPDRPPTRAPLPPPAPSPLRAASNGLIAFTSEPDHTGSGDARSDADIYTMAQDGSRLTRLTNTPQGETGPVWSPDGRRLAFTRSENGDVPLPSNSSVEVYVMDADGSDLRRLTDDDRFDAAPVWSPDSSTIAFTSDEKDYYRALPRFEVWTVAPDGSGRTRLTRDTGSNTDPAWSPDGSQLAFASTRAGSSDLFRMAADGSRPTRLTDTPDSDRAPAWSPDGRRIAFERAPTGGEGAAQLHTIASDGSAPVQLTTGPGGGSRPVWSPDGTRLAYSSTRYDGGGLPGVLVVSADGRNRSRRGDAARPAGRPVWSPDGRTLAFESFFGPTRDVDSIGADGAGEANLTDSPADDRDPAWQPLPAAQPPLSTDVPPTLRLVRLSRHTFRSRAVRRPRFPRGTRVSFRLSEAATVALSVDRRSVGRRLDERCVAASPGRAGRRCERFAFVGRLKRSLPAGARRLTFSGRIGGRALRPGTYVLRLQATDAAGRRSTARSVRFRITPR